MTLPPARPVDTVVIGGGIAGVSAGAFLADAGRSVVVVEMEATLAHHTTGRSAAVLVDGYGHPTVRRLTRAGRAWLDGPPDGLADVPLTTPRGLVWVGDDRHHDALARHVDEVTATGAAAHLIGAHELTALHPALRPERARVGVHEPDAVDLDVGALHQAFVRLLRRRGGQTATRAPVTGLTPGASTWRVDTADGAWSAPVVVNAAGAWGDRVAALAGLEPLGLTPLRRTAFRAPVPSGLDPRPWPMLVSADEDWYVKPEGTGVLCTPADETPSEPCDARPDEIDVATAIERINRATVLGIRSVQRPWAGLRTFSPDRAPVAGFDPDAPGFFWLVGQGGTGIQTSPGLAALTTALVTEQPLPGELVAEGVDPSTTTPARFR